jgi:hypothetical protein
MDGQTVGKMNRSRDILMDEQTDRLTDEEIDKQKGRGQIFCLFCIKEIICLSQTDEQTDR